MQTTSFRSATSIIALLVPLMSPVDGNTAPASPRQFATGGYIYLACTGTRKTLSGPGGRDEKSEPFSLILQVGENEYMTWSKESQAWSENECPRYDQCSIDPTKISIYLHEDHSRFNTYRKLSISRISGYFDDMQVYQSGDGIIIFYSGTCSAVANPALGAPKPKF
jgi:hypothetical protein